jgi:hypothetical protein
MNANFCIKILVLYVLQTSSAFRTNTYGIAEFDVLYSVLHDKMKPLTIPPSIHRYRLFDR